MAQRVGHVRIDQAHQRDIARHCAVTHHMIDTLTLHDDAAQTNPTPAAMQVAAAITAIMAGREPENRVDWARGY